MKTPENANRPPAGDSKPETVIANNIKKELNIIIDAIGTGELWQGEYEMSMDILKSINSMSKTLAERVRECVNRHSKRP
jgi:hypothetical protein